MLGALKTTVSTLVMPLPLAALLLVLGLLFWRRWRRIRTVLVVAAPLLMLLAS